MESYRPEDEPSVPVRATGVERVSSLEPGVAMSKRAKGIASGIRYLTIQNAVNSILGFVFLTSLLRFLSPSDYGLFSSVLLVTGIGSSIAFFGLQSAATRFVAYMAQDESQSRAVTRSIVILSLVFSSVATVGFIVLSPTLSMYFTKSTGSAWVFAVSGVWLFSNTISGIFQGLVQGMRKYYSLARILVGANLAMVCLTVVGLLEFHSILVPIFASVVYCIMISAWSLVITRKELLAPARFQLEVKTIKQVLKYSVPLGIAGILTVATGAGDPLVVGGYLSAAQLGEYYVAIAISGGLGVILFTPLNTTFFPETSWNADDPQKLSNGLRLAIRYTVLALIPVSFALAAMSRQTIDLFSGDGSSYLAANLSLQLMSVFFLFVAMQGILTSLLLSTGKTTQVMIMGAVTVLLDLALSVVLVPSFGLLGAATSRILVDIAGFLVALYLTRRYISGVADFGFQAKVFISSLIVLTVLSSLSTFVSDKTVTLIPYTLLGVGIMVVCARGMHLLTEEDKQHIEHFMPPQAAKLFRAIF